MFEQIEQKTWYPPPWAVMVGTVLGVFGLGVGLATDRRKPRDWALTLTDFAILLIYTGRFAIGVIKRVPRRTG
jgi:hypothetical protein